MDPVFKVCAMDYLRIEKGLKLFHQADNYQIGLQAGDMIYFQCDQKISGVLRDQICAGVTNVDSRNMPPNWVTFGFKLLRTEDARMGFCLSGTTQSPIAQWKLKGYASEEDYERDQDIEKLMAECDRGKASHAKSERKAELQEERDIIRAKAVIGGQK